MNLQWQNLSELVTDGCGIQSTQFKSHSKSRLDIPSNTIKIISDLWALQRLAPRWRTWPWPGRVPSQTRSGHMNGRKNRLLNDDIRFDLYHPQKHRTPVSRMVKAMFPKYVLGSQLFYLFGVAIPNGRTKIAMVGDIAIQSCLDQGTVGSLAWPSGAKLANTGNILFAKARESETYHISFKIKSNIPNAMLGRPNPKSTLWNVRSG